MFARRTFPRRRWPSDRSPIDHPEAARDPLVVYPVRDLVRAIAFYRDAVGLTPTDTSVDGVVSFNLGHDTFSLDARSAATPGTGEGMVFQIDDLDRRHARIRACGFEISDIADFPPCRMAFASDPDGNDFALRERKP